MLALDRNYVRTLDLSTRCSHQQTSDVLDIEFDGSYLVPEGIMARNGCWTEVTAKSVCATHIRRRQRRSPLRLRRASSPRLSDCTGLSVFNQRQQNPGCQEEMKRTAVDTVVISSCHFIRDARNLIHACIDFRYRATGSSPTACRASWTRVYVTCDKQSTGDQINIQVNDMNYFAATGAFRLQFCCQQ